MTRKKGAVIHYSTIVTVVRPLLTVEDWYSHQISNLLQKNNKNKTEGPL